MISNSGNVGIGTPNPLSKLHVAAGSADALELEGGIAVSGPTNNRAAFQLTATSAIYNLGSSPGSSNRASFLDAGVYLRIDNAFTDNNPNAIILLTPIEGLSSNNVTPISPAVFYESSVGKWFIKNTVQYTGNTLTNQNESISSGQSFNVLVIRSY
jgi:hypothetical protein